MKGVSLDFVHRSGPNRRIWVLLAAGLAAALFVGLSAAAVRDRLRATELRVASLERQLLRQPAAPPREPTESAAAGIRQRFATPWTKLFSGIEAAGGEDVALLVLQPEAQGRLRLEAEARNWEAMLSYVARLEESRVLSHLHLVQHETRSADGAHPVRFTLLAQWGTGGGGRP
jgi:hypothetical protein